LRCRYRRPECSRCRYRRPMPCFLRCRYRRPCFWAQYGWCLRFTHVAYGRSVPAWWRFGAFVRRGSRPAMWRPCPTCGCCVANVWVVSSFICWLCLLYTLCMCAWLLMCWRPCMAWGFEHMAQECKYGLLKYTHAYNWRTDLKPEHLAQTRDPCVWATYISQAKTSWGMRIKTTQIYACTQQIYAPLPARKLSSDSSMKPICARDMHVLCWSVRILMHITKGRTAILIIHFHISTHLRCEGFMHLKVLPFS
jgi:hypothetical protein